MPNTRVYPQFTEEQLNTAVNNAFAQVDAAELQQDIEYFQWKLSTVFRLPRRFLGLTDEELAANSELQSYEESRRAERERTAERYQRYIDTLMSVQPLAAPTGIVFWITPTGVYFDKPVSCGLEFKLKKLNLGLANVFL